MPKAYSQKIDRSVRIERIADACGIQKSTAQRIKELRSDFGYTQKTLGDRLKISRAVISDWELGQKLPSVSQYCDLALLFDVDIEYLVGLTREPKVCGVCDKLRGFHEKIVSVDENDENLYEVLSLYFNDTDNSEYENTLIDIGIFNKQGQNIIREIYDMLKTNKKFLK